MKKLTVIITFIIMTTAYAETTNTKKSQTTSSLSSKQLKIIKKTAKKITIKKG